MLDGHHAMWGMHWGWWLFSVLCLGAFLYLAALLLRSGKSGSNSVDLQQCESSKEILEKRYAKGEISTEEYRERKTALDDSHS